MHYYFALWGFTFPDILYSICTQTTQQEPGNPHKHWISELHFLLKLNRSRWLTGQIIHYPVHALDLIDDPVHDLLKYLKWYL